MINPQPIKNYIRSLIKDKDLQSAILNYSKNDGDGDVKVNDFIKHFIKNQPLFKEFTDKELDKITSILEMRTYQLGNTLYNVGDTVNDIFFIMTGEIEFHKKEPETQENLKIAILTTGGMLGDMSFVENTIRTTTVKVIKDTTALILQKDKYEELCLKNPELKQKLITNIARINIARLRAANNSHISSLKQQIKELNIRREFGYFFVLVMITLGIGDVVNRVAINYTVDVTSRSFNWLYIIFLMLPTLLFIKYFKYNIEDFGVTLKNSAHSIKIGLVYGIVCSCLLIIPYYAFEIYKGKSFSAITLNYQAFNFMQLSYLFHSYFQEFIGRGIFQNSVRRFFDDTTGNKSVLLTATLFAVLHIQFGFVVAITTFIGGCAFGFIYLKNNNLIGVSIVHFLTGTTLRLINLL